VFRILRRRGHRGGVRGDLLRLGGDVGGTGCGRLPRFNLGPSALGFGSPMPTL
jgi:hypothetical protein